MLQIVIERSAQKLKPISQMLLKSLIGKCETDKQIYTSKKKYLERQEKPPFILLII